MKVYLAGGMRTEWRKAVMLSAPQHTYISPTEHGVADPRGYTAWDLAAIRESAALFGYLAADNPSGYGLAAELGYAKGKDKLVILADEKTAVEPSVARYLAFLRMTADVTFDNLGLAIEYLRTLPA